MKRKSCLVVTLALCLLLLFSAAAMAEESDALFVGGVDLLAEGAVAPAGVSYDPATNTLTLTNAQLTQGYVGSLDESGAGYCDGIRVDGGLNIVLVGANSIDLSKAAQEHVYGVYSNGAVTFSGSGSLTISGCDYGIAINGDLFIESGSYTIKDALYGLYCYEDIITVNGGRLAMENCTYGLSSDFTVFNGGSFMVSGSEDALRTCDLTVNGGHLKLAGSHAALVLVNYEATAEEAQSGFKLAIGPSVKIIAGGQFYKDKQLNSYSFEDKDEDGQPFTNTWYYELGTIAPAEPEFVHEELGSFTITGAAKEVEIVGSGFSDVLVTDYFFDGVNYVTAAGLMNGVGGGLFAPAGQMTRGMLVTVLWRMAGSPETYADKAPADSGSYGKAAVGWAYDTGVITGYGDGTLRLDQAISREQLAAFLYRYEQAQGGGFAEGWEYELDFADAEAISDYAYEAMAWCVMNGILNGVGNDMLSPGGFATRGQMATMLQRYAAVERPEAAE